ncbi:MAG: response regulator transcription factor [Patescibacteria group bacterium]|jgi:DNA-binding response OmpR family regulator
MANKQKKILVAEDEKPLAKVLQLKLEKEGFVVTVVNDGAAAIAALDGDFNAIMLDLVMPKDDGFDVLKAAKEKKITTPIIVLTNLSQETDMALAKSLGAVDCLIKSETPLDEVVVKVKNIVK